MKFGSALLSTSFLLASSPAAVAAAVNDNGDMLKIFENGSSITTESKLGQRIMSKARSLNENNYYTRWMADYSIKFDGCVAVPAFEREEGLSANMLAKFKLCPSDKCGSCPNAGEYAVELREFVETFQEAQREANEYACENQEQTCEYQCQNGQYNYNNDDGGNNNNNQNNNNNNNNNEDYCKYQCLVDAGMSYCSDDNGGGEQMDMQEFAECRAMEEGQQNNNNGQYNNGQYQMYYTGAYCTSDGVYAALFLDSACSQQAPAGTYEKMNYGYSLPTESMIQVECQSCKINNYNNGNNNNNNNNGENNNNNQNQNNGDGYVLEMCEELYEQAARCEKNVKDLQYQDTSGCELIHKILPSLNNAFNGMTHGGPTAAKVLAWVFGFLVAFMGVYIYWLHRKVIRQKISLASLGVGDTPSHNGEQA